MVKTKNPENPDNKVEWTQSETHVTILANYTVACHPDAIRHLDLIICLLLFFLVT